MLPEFVNAIITLNTTGSYQLYKGATASGGSTVVSIESRRAEGYNQGYFKIKQTVVEPGKQAYVQKYDIPSLEIVHKLILMSIEEGYHGRQVNRGCDQVHSNRTGESEGDNSNGSVHSTIPIVTAKSRPVNKIISSTPIRAERATQTESSSNGSLDEYGSVSGLDDELESFMPTGGIKIANMRGFNTTKPVRDGQAAAEHRGNMESILDSEIF